MIDLSKEYFKASINTQEQKLSSQELEENIHIINNNVENINEKEPLKKRFTNLKIFSMLKNIHSMI